MAGPATTPISREDFRKALSKTLGVSEEKAGFDRIPPPTRADKRRAELANLSGGLEALPEQGTAETVKDADIALALGLDAEDVRINRQHGKMDLSFPAQAVQEDHDTDLSYILENPVLLETVRKFPAHYRNADARHDMVRLHRGAFGKDAPNLRVGPGPPSRFEITKRGVERGLELFYDQGEQGFNAILDGLGIRTMTGDEHKILRASEDRLAKLPPLRNEELVFEFLRPDGFADIQNEALSGQGEFIPQIIGTLGAAVEGALKGGGTGLVLGGAFGAVTTKSIPGTIALGTAAMVGGAVVGGAGFGAMKIIRDEAGLAFIEDRDAVYRGHPTIPDGTPIPEFDRAAAAIVYGVVAGGLEFGSEIVAVLGGTKVFEKIVTRAQALAAKRWVKKEIRKGLNHPSSRSFLLAVASRVLITSGTEAGTETTQTFAGQARQDTLESGAPKLPDEGDVSQALASGRQAAFAVGGFAAAQGTLTQTHARISGRERGVKVLERLRDAVAQAKIPVKELSPSMWRATGGPTLRDAGQEKVDVAAKPLLTLYQDDKEKLLDALPGIADQLDEALELGGDVQVDTIDYFDVLDDQFGDDALDIVRFDGLTAEEADAAGPRADEEAETDARTEAQRRERKSDLDLALELVFQDALESQIAAGERPEDARPIAFLRMQLFRKRAEDRNIPIETLLDQQLGFQGPRGEARKGEGPQLTAQEKIQNHRLGKLLDDLRFGVQPELRGLPSFPILQALRELGGVDPDSPLGVSLKALDLSNKVFRGLFRKGGITDTDAANLAQNPIFHGNVTGSEGADVTDTAHFDPESETLPRDFLLEAIANEVAGKPLRSQAQLDEIAERAEPRAELERELNERELNLEDFTNEEILAELRLDPDDPGAQPLIPTKPEGKPKATPTGGKGQPISVLAQAGDVVDRAVSAFNAGLRRFFQGAFHGSRADFDIFSTDFVGTGEGAQAFGWGLYFATRRAIADFYRTVLTGEAIPTLVLDGVNLTESLPRFVRGESSGKILNDLGIDAFQAGVIQGLARGDFESLEQYIETQKNGPEPRGPQDKRRRVEAGESLRDRLKVTGIKGQLFEVELPDDDNLMDWETDLANQHPEVRAKLERLRQNLAELLPEFTGSVHQAIELAFQGVQFEGQSAQASPSADFFYQKLAEALGTDRAASELLARAGILGHKFLDNVSRDERQKVFVDGQEVGGKSTTFFEQEAAATLKDFGTIEAAIESERVALDSKDRRDTDGISDLRGVIAVLESWKGKDVQVRTEGTHNFVIYDDKAIQIVSKFFQNEGTTIQGEIQVFDAELKKVIIRMTKARDMSSMLHEMGHYFFLTSLLDAQRGDASQQLLDDMAKLVAWLGADSVEALTGKHHEKLAKALEIYFFEGNAPSLELEGVFGRFRQWMRGVYVEIQKVFGFELTDEVREIFGRMMATDAQIAAKAGGVSPVGSVMDVANPAPMTQAEVAELRALVEAEQREQQNAVEQKVLRIIKRQKTKEYKDREKVVRAEVAADVDSRPIFRAKHWLRTGKFLGDPIEGLEHEKLSGTELRKIFGKGFHLVFVGLFQAEGGLNPEIVAELFGFQGSTLDFLNALVAVRGRKEVIKEETKERMGQIFDDPLATGEINELAEQEATQESTIKRLILLHRVHARTGGKTLTPKKVLRGAAKRIIADTEVGDLDPTKHRRDAERAELEALEAAQAGDFDAVADAKRREILNRMLEMEARAAREKSDSNRRFLQKHTLVRFRKAIGKAGEGFLEQLDGLLVRFELRKAAPREVRTPVGMAEWISNYDGDPDDIIIPGQFRDPTFRKNWRDLTVDELQGLRDSVQNIAHLARKSRKVILEQEEMDLVDAETEIVAVARAQFPERSHPKEINLNPWRAGKKTARWIDQNLQKVEHLIDGLTGGDTNSALWRLVWVPLKEAGARRRQMMEDYSGRIQDLFDALMADGKTRGYDTKFAEDVLPSNDPTKPGMPKGANKWNLIVVALNLGSESNMNKLLDGRGWTEDQVMRVLDEHLTKEDWDFVQGAWNQIHTLWEPIAALERRDTGVVPPEVQRREVVTRHGVFKGGYFPVAYEPHTDIGTRRAQKEIMPGAGEDTTRATTGHGWTNARTKVTGPLQVELDLLSSHIEQVILDLTHREAIHNANKVLSRPAVREMMKDLLGEEFSFGSYWEPWLKHIARDTTNSSVLAWHHKVARHLRISGTVFKLGLRASTLIMQVSGHFNAYNLLRNHIPNAGHYWILGVQEAMGKFEPTRAATTYNRVLQLSEFMRTRTVTGDRELRDLVRTVQAKTGIGKKANMAGFGRWSLGLIAKVQLLLVDLPVWLAAERAALEKMGMNQAEAVVFADTMVSQSQGSGSALDLSAVQRGGKLGSEWIKSMTLFYSYNNTVYAQLRAAGRGKTFKDTPEFLHNYLYIAMLPAIFSMVVHMVGRAGWPGDEDEFDLTVVDALVSILLGDAAGTIPLARDIWPAFAGRNPRESAAYQIFLDSVRDLKSSRDELDTMFDIIRFGFMVRGLPGDQVLEFVEDTLRD